MQAMGKPTTYDAMSRINHWLIGLAIIGMLASGLFMEFSGLPRADIRTVSGLHRSFGVLVLIFGLWRVVWRLVQGFPEAIPGMPSWQDTASKIAHWALLAGIIIMPVSGIASSVFAGRAVSVFGWFSIPAQAEIPAIDEFASATHGFVGRALAALVILHVLAALKHHFIDKDRTLTRMVSGG